MDNNKSNIAADGYESPRLDVVGKLHEVTKSGVFPNADTPSGPNNTAFPPGS